MKQLKYICAQPAIIYYEWHLEVMIHNFRKNGIQDEHIHIVLGKTDTNSESVFERLRVKYPNVVIGLYTDTRLSREYVSSLRPHVLKKHFIEHPSLCEDVIFYHDCDIAFTKPVDWSELLSDDIWYVSNTTSYIGASYIKSKKLNIFQEMCEIVGVSAEKVEAEENNSGGAQYIMKNVTPLFWDKVERDSEELVKYFKEKTSEYKNIQYYHPIQAWTADMWAVLWNGWYFSHIIKVSDKMNFCWPSENSKMWDSCFIYHNAGVIGPDTKMFYKGQYTTKFPTHLSLQDYESNNCSYRYVQEIIEALGGNER